MLVSFLVVVLLPVLGVKFLGQVPALTGILPGQNFLRPGSGQILPGPWQEPIYRSDASDILRLVQLVTLIFRFAFSFGLSKSGRPRLSWATGLYLPCLIRVRIVAGAISSSRARAV